MIVVMGWLGRSRFRARPASEARYLVQPLSSLIVGLIDFAFFAGIAIISNVFPNETTTWLTTSVFAGGALMGLVIVYGYLLEKHEVADEGFTSRNLTGARISLQWSDLRSVRYAPSMKWFRLETNSGKIARISALVMGLPEFAQLLLKNAPQASIDSSTLDVLNATAAGNPPSAWM